MVVLHTKLPCVVHYVKTASMIEGFSCFFPGPVVYSQDLVLWSIFAAVIIEYWFLLSDVAIGSSCLLLVVVCSLSSAI
jgi:hypothetical protein